MNSENKKNHSHSRKRKKRTGLLVIIGVLIAIIIVLVFIIINSLPVIVTVENSAAKITNESSIETSAKSNNSPININSVKLISDYNKNTSIDEMETVKFGSYPQSDASGNTKDPIEWIVLERKDNKALLLSKYILDCKCYNNEFKEVTWETCDLRKWLNNDFYNRAFSDKEKSVVSDTDVVNADNSEYNSKGGNNTIDKVFCLSIDEVKKYLGAGEKDRDGLVLYDNAVTKGTNYAKETNNFNSKLEVFNEVDKTYEKYFGNSTYWLRSPGYFQNCATSVLYIPTLDLSGLEMGNNRSDFGVRPAIWIEYFE